MMKVSRITIATLQMLPMVTFYNQLFQANLQPVGNHGMYIGEFLTFEILLCPNEIVGIEAEKNRIQFRIEVEDVDDMIQACIEAGGQPYGEIRRNGIETIGGICDPDGNSIELIQQNGM